MDVFCLAGAAGRLDDPPWEDLSVSEVLVLCYHAVSPTWDSSLAVAPDVLEAQLTSLVRRGWRGATFRDAVRSPPSKRTLAVTFDDAYLSVLQLAQPIMERLGLPGTVFVPTAFAPQRQRLRWDGIEQWLATPSASELECMSWRDLEGLVQDGWEVGSHTRTHPRLTQLDDDGVRHELVQSRRECTAALGAPCETLAYPYGDVDDRVARFTAAAGYSAAAILSSSLRNDGPHRWPRVGIYHGDTRWRFRLKTDAMVRRIRSSPLWPDHE
jgi:peptidoglycan/xylan/chitin deacetylase (PgdA/CDA1 family)